VATINLHQTDLTIHRLAIRLALVRHNNLLSPHSLLNRMAGFKTTKDLALPLALPI
jgi:hypothetical protein